MGLMDNLRGLFSGSKNNQVEQTKENNEYEKIRLANSIVDLVSDIKKINSFDKSIWNLSTVTNYELKRKSIEELNKIKSDLENRLSELHIDRQKVDSNNEAREASKWTGNKPKDMSDYEFDRYQRSDDR